METDNTNYDLTGTFNATAFRVLRYYARSLSKVQIGEKFGKSKGWADKEIGKIYKTLGVHTRQEMAMEAWDRDIFTKLNSKLTMEAV